MNRWEPPSQNEPLLKHDSSARLFQPVQYEIENTAKPLEDSLSRLVLNENLQVNPYIYPVYSESTGPPRGIIFVSQAAPKWPRTFTPRPLGQ